jgi:hypothetical protein
MMFSTLKTAHAGFGSLILICLLLSQPALAQNRITGPTSIPTQQQPGIFTSVTTGQIVVPQSAPNSQTNGGQFGFTPNGNQTPVNLPRNPGIQFQPPPSFSGSSAQQQPNDAVGLIVDGGFLDSPALQRAQDQAKLAAVSACSSGTQAACESALRALGVATRALYPTVTQAVLGGILLTSFRQVISGVRLAATAAGTRAINIATIDEVFAQLVPESTATRPSSPS